MDTDAGGDGIQDVLEKLQNEEAEEGNEEDVAKGIRGVEATEVVEVGLWGNDIEDDVEEATGVVRGIIIRGEEGWADERCRGTEEGEGEIGVQGDEDGTGASLEDVDEEAVGETGTGMGTSSLGVKKVRRRWI